MAATRSKPQMASDINSAMAAEQSTAEHGAHACHLLCAQRQPFEQLIRPIVTGG